MIRCQTASASASLSGHWLETGTTLFRDSSNAAWERVQHSRRSPSNCSWLSAPQHNSTAAPLALPRASYRQQRCSSCCVASGCPDGGIEPSRSSPCSHGGNLGSVPAAVCSICGSDAAVRVRGAAALLEAAVPSQARHVGGALPWLLRQLCRRGRAGDDRSRRRLRRREWHLANKRRRQFGIE